VLPLIEEGHRVAQANHYHTVWEITEELGLLVDAELHFGLPPSIPFGTMFCIGDIHNAYRAWYIGIPFEDVRGQPIVTD